MGALSILSLVWSVASSRGGLMAIAGTVCFAVGYHKAFEACDARHAAAQAAQLRAQLVERARQARAAAADTIQDRMRAQATAGAAAAMQAEIDRLRAELSAPARNEAAHAEAKFKTPPALLRACPIDRDFARRVRRIDAAGR